MWIGRVCAAWAEAAKKNVIYVRSCNLFLGRTSDTSVDWFERKCVLILMGADVGVRLPRQRAIFK